MSPPWTALSLLIFGGFVFLHGPVTALCDSLVQRIGFGPYERTAAALSLLAVVAAGVATVRHRSATTVTLPFLLALMGLMALVQPLLILINIENVHFAQYALLAVLLARAGLALEQTWLAATGLGAIDEAYQYLFLRAGRPDRLDWNDIIFNAIGAATGVALFLHYSRTTGLRRARYSWKAIAMLLLPLTGVALVARPPVFSPFYSVTPAGLSSHELTVSEGLLLTGVLWIAVHELVRRVIDHQTAGDPSAEAVTEAQRNR